MDNLNKKIFLRNILNNWNMPMNSFATWNWVILKHVFISFYINKRVITKQIYNILLCME